MSEIKKNQPEIATSNNKENIPKKPGLLRAILSNTFKIGSEKYWDDMGEYVEYLTKQESHNESTVEKEIATEAVTAIEDITTKVEEELNEDSAMLGDIPPEISEEAREEISTLIEQAEHLKTEAIRSVKETISSDTTKQTTEEPKTYLTNEDRNRKRKEAEARKKATRNRHKKNAPTSETASEEQVLDTTDEGEEILEPEDQTIISDTTNGGEEEITEVPESKSTAPLTSETLPREPLHENLKLSESELNFAKETISFVDSFKKMSPDPEWNEHLDSLLSYMDQRYQKINSGNIDEDTLKSELRSPFVDFGLKLPLYFGNRSDIDRSSEIINLGSFGEIFKATKYRDSKEFKKFNEFCKKHFQFEVFLPEINSPIDLKNSKIIGAENHTNFEHWHVIGIEIPGIYKFKVGKDGKEEKTVETEARVIIQG